MAQIPNLDNAPLNLKSIREQSQRDLVNILKNIRGKKCLVIDPKLSGSLSLIVPTSTLKVNSLQFFISSLYLLNSYCGIFNYKQEYGIELRLLSAEPVQTECTKVVYFVHPEFNSMRFISFHIHDDASKGLQREYFLYFVPRRSVACEKILEEEQVHNLMTIGEYPLYMVPLDEDVLSFELDLALKWQVDGDASSLWHIAKAIHKLEFTFGLIPNVRAKGKASVRVAEILNRMQTEEPVSTSDMSMPEINTLIIIDREVDMVTPMCSQLTYEGLVDEFLRINNGSVELDGSIMGVQQQEGKKIKVPLNSRIPPDEPVFDKLFKEIRDMNFEVVVQVLRQKATSMKQDYAEMSTTTIAVKFHSERMLWLWSLPTLYDSQTVSELKDFVKKLNSLPEMTRHINLAQHLSTFTSKPSFLGQLDMEHTIIEAQSYDMREILHSYGFEHVAALSNLEKAGLLRKQEAKSNWLTIKRALQLVVEDTDTASPNDISYVFSGYAPLSIRLIQNAVRSGWRPMEEILKLLPGPHSETKRGGFSNSPSFDTLPGSQASVDKVADGRRSTVLVVFIGGVTFAEISALRFLSAQEGMAYDIIVGTTKIINGNSLAETFLEKLG
ncbi:hypothetical protein EZV62_025351 [Acer yangbiense]|uniref:Uncharacterized protein n=1 Tax=Acer yangbiense TaxID=1000413 RepID=A0A5C7GZL4_9ROSI|nr:hypothetical protein EZV62_025351 [Acer yangbiense]